MLAKRLLGLSGVGAAMIFATGACSGDCVDRLNCGPQADLPTTTSTGGTGAGIPAVGGNGGEGGSASGGSASGGSGGSSAELMPQASISGGTYHTCATSPAGAVKCWGAFGPDPGQSSMVPTLISDMGVVKTVAGHDHSCRLLVDGTVECWGNNDQGQLGQASLMASSAPLPVGGIPAARDIATSDSHTCIVTRDDSKVYCWGRNSSLQLGVNTGVSFSANPVQAPVFSAKSVSPGSSHTCIIDDDDSVWCWGPRWLLGSGDSAVSPTATPSQAVGLDDVVSLSAGQDFTCAGRADGAAFCWGEGGRLGDGTMNAAHQPVQVQDLGTVTQISAGGWHACALLRNGNASCWGNNLFYALGNADDDVLAQYQDALTPSLVVGLPGGNGLSLDASVAGHTCVLYAGSQAWCWGSDDDGKLGDGAPQEESNVAVQVQGL